MTNANGVERLKVRGGVFPLEDVTASLSSSDVSIWTSWTSNIAAVYGFRSARSALRYTLESRNSGRVWLPAYCCTEIVDALAGLPIEICFYAVSDLLAPDVDYLDEHLQPGDAVVGINYFGRPMDDEWLQLVHGHVDVLWIEDCAQCLTPHKVQWSMVRIYSPRKLVGVPDGGILVDIGGILSPPVLRAQSSDALLRPYLLRKQDPDGYQHDVWYPKFKYAESLMFASDIKISEYTEKRLRHKALVSVLNPRRNNYAALYRKLSEIALWKFEQPNWAPLGFPILVKDASELAARLASEKIFAPRHWAVLPKSEYSVNLSETAGGLLTLPCDQRYDERDMEEVARAVLTAIT